MPKPKPRLTTNIVPPIGPYSAKICFIGEAPGEEENWQGEPFVGNAGQRLNWSLSTVGLMRPEVLIANVFSQQPPKNDVNHFFDNPISRKYPKLTPEGEEHVEVLRVFLRRLKEKSNVNIIVALGAPAMWVLTGHKKIENWRGSLLPCTLVEGFKVYPTYHPSYVNRLLNERQEKKLSGEKKKRAINVLPVFIRDLERVKEQSHFPELLRPQREFEIDLTCKEYIERLDYMTEHEQDSAVDIETLPSPEGPLLWCIGFSTSPSKAFVIPFIKGRSFAWPIEQEAKILQAISRFFLCKALKIFHNGAQYDLPVLGRYYGLRCADGTYSDVRWLHHASYPYIRSRLAMLVSIYTWEPYYKDAGKVHYGKRTSDVQEFIYNGRDDCCTREIFDVVLQDARELETLEGYERTIRCSVSHLSMTLRGVKIDQTKKAYLTRRFGDQVAYHENAVREETGTEYNLNSSDQKRRLLYGELGLEIQYKRSTGKVTVDKEALQKLKKKYPDNPILNHLLEYQKFKKLLSTYAEMELDTDGRMRTTYNYVSTWRTSSSGSPFVFNLKKKDQAGGNLQNIPQRTEEGRKVRELFIPDTGKIMLASDLAQAEDREVVWDSGNLERIYQYLSADLDPHWEFTKVIFSMPSNMKYLPKVKYKDIYTKEEHELKWYRDVGKTIRHAVNYDMGPYQFQAELAGRGIHLPFGIICRILETAKASDPFLSEWKRNIREELKSTRTLITPLGRRRQFFGRLNDATYRAAYAFKPQSTVGELLQLAIQDIWDKHDYIQPLLNVHDEVVTQIFPEDLQRATAAIKNCMEIPHIVGDRELIIPCDFKIGPSWGELKEYSYEEIMNSKDPIGDFAPWMKKGK